MADRFDVEHCDKLINAEAEKFIAPFEKTFSEHNEKNISVEQEKKEGDLDCEDSAITEFLAKVANKIRENILSDSQNSKAAKFLRIIDSFFHATLSSRKGGQN